MRTDHVLTIWRQPCLRLHDRLTSRLASRRRRLLDAIRPLTSPLLFRRIMLLRHRERDNVEAELGGYVVLGAGGEPVPDPQHPPADCRLSHEPPAAIAKRGWRYHHIGIPTDVQRPGETHLAEHGLYVAGFSTSPYGVEWMRFEKSSPLPELIKTVPHVAFEVDDLEAALEGQEVICPPGSPSEGVRAAMIVDHGALVELIWFRKNRDAHQA